MDTFQSFFDLLLSGAKSLYSLRSFGARWQTRPTRRSNGNNNKRGQVNVIVSPLPAKRAAP
jgi:hypothetical protein